MITGNNASNNDYGIRMYDSSSNNNLLYHNNLIDNTQNAYDYSTNYWDNGYPSGGNYWDDYTGEDTDGDGIGDTSYPIPGGTNEDRYPLMDPWTEAPVFLLGTITNLNVTENYKTFYAKFLLYLCFKPFTFNIYRDYEEIMISNDYFGFVGQGFIIGRFHTDVISETIFFSNHNIGM